jgi:hypothetical protein
MIVKTAVIAALETVSKRDQFLITVKAERTVRTSAAVYLPVHIVVLRMAHKLSHQLFERQLSSAFLS